MAEKYQIMQFELNGNFYGVDIKYINGIYKAHNLKIVSLPNFSEAFLGITSLRGKIYPVMDLQKKLGYQGVNIDEVTKFIIMNVDGKDLGVLVDEVTDILKPYDEEINDANDLSFGRSPFISNIIKTEDSFVITLEMEKLIENDEILSINMETILDNVQ